MKYIENWFLRDYPVRTDLMTVTSFLVVVVVLIVIRAPYELDFAQAVTYPEPIGYFEFTFLTQAAFLEHEQVTLKRPQIVRPF